MVAAWKDELPGPDGLDDQARRHRRHEGRLRARTRSTATGTRRTGSSTTSRPPTRPSRPRSSTASATAPSRPGGSPAIGCAGRIGGTGGLAVAELTVAAETYTHGHHESVLRSHRWRTAENSAAYLLPHLDARAVAARRRLRSGHDHARPRPAGRAGPGRSASTPSRTPLDRRAGRCRGGRASRTSPIEVGDAYALRVRRRSRSTSSTPTRCSSTSPTRWRRCARWAGSAGSAGSWRRATATTRR